MITKTPLLKRLEALEALEQQVELLMVFANTQSQINARLAAMINDARIRLLSKQEENDTAPHSGLILPDRLNS